MTTIAWDGKTLAVDSRMTGGNVVRSERVQKLWKINDFWIAGCGDYQDVLLAVAWFRGGMPSADKPKFNDPGGLVILMQKGRSVWRYEGNLVGWNVAAQFVAAGSGFEIALGALAMGATAAEAVKIAARFDPGTNKRVRSSK